MIKDFYELCNESVNYYVENHIACSNQGKLKAEQAWVDCYREFQNSQNITKYDENLMKLLHAYSRKWGLTKHGNPPFPHDKPHVHCEPITILFNSKYDKLWNIDKIISTPNECSIEDTIYLLENLKDELDNAYEQSNNKIPSAVALTKVLLGTMGCAPGFDTNVREGVKIVRNAATEGMISCHNPKVLNTLENLRADDSIPSNFNPNYLKCGMSSFLAFAREFCPKLTELQTNTQIKIDDSYCTGNKKNGQTVVYPLMKIIDMIFWSIGFKKGI